jgi:hypothetical protein
VVLGQAHTFGVPEACRVGNSVQPQDKHCPSLPVLVEHRGGAAHALIVAIRRARQRQIRPLIVADETTNSARDHFG